eukprot:PhM_4_TR13309/c2_g1_i5/m.77051
MFGYGHSHIGLALARTPTHRDTDTHRPVDGQHDRDLHGDGHSGVRYSLPHLAVDGNNGQETHSQPLTESRPTSGMVSLTTACPAPGCREILRGGTPEAHPPQSMRDSCCRRTSRVETPSTTLTVGATLSGVLTLTRTPGARDLSTR